MRLPNLSPTEFPPIFRDGGLLWPDLASQAPLEQKPAPFPVLGCFSFRGNSTRVCGQKVLCSLEDGTGPSEGARGGLGARASGFYRHPQVEASSESRRYLDGGSKPKPELTFENEKILLT